MLKKTVKNLDSEFSEFKDLFRDLQAKFNLLSDELEALDKIYDEVMSKKGREFQCDVYDANKVEDLGKMP